MDPKRRMGPNFKKFLFLKMAKDAIPDGGGLADGVLFLSNKQSLADGLRSALIWCDAAVEAVRSAKNPNPWKHSSEEEIAGELISRIEARKRA